jgi:histidinol-phosphate aminotransferase
MRRSLSIAALAAEPVTHLSPYVPGKPLTELEREYGIRDAVKLASNENPHALPPGAQAVIRAGLNDIARYPDGACFELRAALAAHLNVAPEMLTLGNGSNDVLVLLAECFLTAATNAVYDQYSFIVYRLAVQATGAEARVAAANPADHPQPLGHDLDAMLALVDEQTRLIFVANPNNPTGTWLGAAELRRFLEALPEHVIAVIDEAYYEYARGEGYPEALGWLGEFPNLVVTRTFSKAYGLAGLRAGYAVSSPEIAELLNRVRQPFNVNSLAQRAAMHMLGEEEWLQSTCADTIAERERVRAALEARGLASVPSRGNFLLVRVPRAAECNEFLLRHGVIVRPVANYGLPDYLRISIGTRAENERLLAGMSAFLTESAP